MELIVKVVVATARFQGKDLFRIVDAVVALMLHVDADSQGVHVGYSQLGSIFAERMFDFLGKVFKSQYCIGIGVGITGSRDDLEAEPAIGLIPEDMLDMLVTTGEFFDDLAAIGVGQ